MKKITGIIVASSVALGGLSLATVVTDPAPATAAAPGVTVVKHKAVGIPGSTLSVFHVPRAVVKVDSINIFYNSYNYPLWNDGIRPKRFTFKVTPKSHFNCNGPIYRGVKGVRFRLTFRGRNGSSLKKGPYMIKCKPGMQSWVKTIHLKEEPLLYVGEGVRHPVTVTVSATLVIPMIPDDQDWYDGALKF